MPWSPNDADPVARKRRELEEAQRLISEQVSRLTEELHQSVDPAVLEKKPIEHPVWRMEDDHHIRPPIEPGSARKRNLARQRQRDMILFFIVLGFFLLVLLVVLWIWHTHYAAASGGA